MTDEFQRVRIDRLTYGGDGMGVLADGRAVFVPFTLAGEEVAIRIREQRRNYCRADLVEVLAASPKRIQPRCVHFGVCGGCHYQHVSAEDQLEIRREILRDQLARIARLPEAAVAVTIPSAKVWEYRNTLQFHLTPAGKPGFMAQRSHQVIDISECHIHESALMDLWPLLEAEPGSFERASLRVGADEEILLVLETPEIPELSLEELPISVVALHEDSSVVLAGEAHTMHEVNGRVFRVSAGSFFQVNPAVSARLVDLVLAGLQPVKTDRILDLFCGVGLFSAFLAAQAGEVVGVELSEAACTDFAENLDEFDNVTLYEGAVEAVLPGLEGRFEKAVLDPPRSGLSPEALEALLQLAPQRLVYVSCDPATLARDLRRLSEAGYQLLSATPLEMFPQTYHFETVAVVEKG